MRKEQKKINRFPGKRRLSSRDSLHNTGSRPEKFRNGSIRTLRTLSYLKVRTVHMEKGRV